MSSLHAQPTEHLAPPAAAPQSGAVRWGSCVLCAWPLIHSRCSRNGCRPDCGQEACHGARLTSTCHWHPEASCMATWASVSLSVKWELMMLVLWGSGRSVRAAPGGSRRQEVLRQRRLAALVSGWPLAGYRRCARLGQRVWFDSVLRTCRGPEVGGPCRALAVALLSGPCAHWVSRQRLRG